MDMDSRKTIDRRLARVEGQIAIDALVRRLPGLELATHQPEYRQSLTLRGLKTLPVKF